MAALHRDDASVITAEPHAVAVQAQPYGYAGAPVHPHNNNYETGSVAAPPPSSDPFAPQAAMQTWKNAHVASPSAPVSFPQVAAAYPPPYSMVAGEGSATGLVVTQPPPLRFVTGMSQPMLPGADTSPDTQPVLEHKPGEYTSHGSEQNATAGRARVKRGCCAPCCAPCDRCLAKDFEHSLGSCFALDALVSTLCCLWCQWTATRVKVHESPDTCSDFFKCCPTLCHTRAALRKKRGYEMAPCRDCAVLVLCCPCALDQTYREAGGTHDNCGGDDTCRESNCYYCYGDPSGSGGGCCCEGTACDCYPCTGQCGVCVNAPDGPCCNACDALWNGGDCCTASMYSDLCCCGACKCTECHSLCNALERGCLPDEACCNVGICASDCQCEGNGGDCDCGGCDCGGCDCNISC